MWRAIYSVTGYLVLYVALIVNETTFFIGFFMLLFAPFLLVWMVIRILKDKHPGHRTFNSYYYEDADYKP